MGIFNKNKNVVSKAASTVAPNVSSHSAGVGVSLSKGSKLSLVKNPTNTIEVSNGWKASDKDYDLKALVRYHNGKLIYIGAANRDEALRTPDGAVTHGGDARKAGELETITIIWNRDIASVAVSSYSALENGAGSFHEYGVYVEIKDGSQTVNISADDASTDGGQYTLCFGEIIFEAEGAFSVVNHELYSKSGSDKRIGYRGDKVKMDIGPEGKSK